LLHSAPCGFVVLGEVVVHDRLDDPSHRHSNADNSRQAYVPTLPSSPVNSW
jgi:hypothetical protein